MQPQAAAATDDTRLLAVNMTLTSSRRLTLALLFGAGWIVGRHLHLSGDLRKFMPRLDPTTPAMRSQAAAAADDTRLLVLA